MENKTRKIATRPNYKQIYLDFIEIKCPEKKPVLQTFLSKDKFSISDVLRINDLLFEENFSENQKFRSYDSKAIFEILDYQKKHQLNNTQLAKYFKLSRNTITSWRRKFIV